MHRRGVLAAAGGACAIGPGRLARAQGRGVKRIGELTPWPADDPQRQAHAAVYADAFRARGWEPERNLLRLRRTGPRDAPGWAEAARELVAEGADVIVAYDDVRIAAAMQATRTVPIVAISGAPVELGFAQTLVRPGGNVTGVSFQSQDENGRVLQLLREIRPGLAKVGIPLSRASRPWAAWFDSIGVAARPAGITVVALPAIASPAAIAPMLDAARDERIDALVMPILPFLDSAAWRPITAWAIEQRVVTRGPLLSRGEAVLAFGANVTALLRLHADQIDRVLRGADPATLPIVQPTLWDTVINQRLARAVGWPAPRSVLVQATEVID